MKKTLLALLALAAGSAGAQAQVFRPSVVQGAVLGGIAGAVIGNNTGERDGAQGALIGAVAGGLIGAAYDHRTQPTRSVTVVSAPPPPQVVCEPAAPVYDYRTVEVRTGPTRYVYRPAVVVVAPPPPVVVYRSAPRIVYARPPVYSGHSHFGHGHGHDRHHHRDRGRHDGRRGW